MDPNANRPPVGGPFWDEDAPAVLELLRDLVCEALAVHDEAYCWALTADPGLGMAGGPADEWGMAGPGRETYDRLVPLVNQVQAIWYDTPAGGHLPRAHAPVFLDEGRAEGRAARVSASCMHELGIVVAVGLLHAIRENQAAKDYVASVRTYTAADTDASARQVLANLAAAVRCEWREATDRLSRKEVPRQGPTPDLAAPEWQILRVLAGSPHALTQDEIGERTDPKLSRRTVGRHLPHLRNLGLTVRQNSGGESITARGRTIAQTGE